MINEILDISKIQADVMKLNYKTFDVAVAIKEVLNIIKPLADKKKMNIIFNCNFANEAELDYQKLQQIMYNLLSNAIKYTGENGDIEVDVFAEDNMLNISVKDNGIGIDKKDYVRIFDKFVQLETPYTKTGSSTGLGLTITKKFVEMMNGTITVESEKEKGSVFIVVLPLKNS